jgi:hypothetical protein
MVCCLRVPSTAWALLPTSIRPTLLPIVSSPIAKGGRGSAPTRTRYLHYRHGRLPRPPSTPSSPRRRLRAQAKPLMARSVPPHANQRAPPSPSIPASTSATSAHLRLQMGRPTVDPPHLSPKTQIQPLIPKPQIQTKVRKLLPVALLHPLSFQTLLNISFSNIMLTNSCC